MKRILVLVLIVLLAVLYVLVQLVVRSTPSVTAGAVTVSATLPGTSRSLSWPSQGEAAIGVVGSGLLGTDGGQRATPLASVTKLMTAYLILHDHPMTSTSVGPEIAVTPADTSTYTADKAEGDSVVQVRAGERLNELQALEGLLIPSGDNIANLLAVWDSGSESAFVSKMNATAKSLGLTDTHYADSSGVAPGSDSSAASVTRLAMLDMANPAFRSIVSTAQVVLPVAGLVYNVDSELGKDGIIGIKTGWTPSAGGCFVFAATAKIDGARKTIVGTILRQFGTKAQPSPLNIAFKASFALLNSAKHAIETKTVVRAGESLGHLFAPWSTPVPLQTPRSVTLTGMAGTHVRVAIDLPSHVATPVAAHQRLGSAVVSLGDERVTLPLYTTRALSGPSLTWRLSDV